MDEALVPTAQRLRIRRSNFRLLSDIKSKELTLQLVYDVLRIFPFFKAFLVTSDVPQIYMQEFWVTATVHHHAIRFKMDNKKHIVNMESVKECYTSVRGFMVNLLMNDRLKRRFWPSFIFLDTVQLSGRSLMDDHMFSTIKLVSRHQNMQQFGALLPIELTNDEIRNSKAYKEYYAIATGEAAPMPKASVRRTRNSSNTSITPPTAAASPRLTAFAKGKQIAKASKAKSLSAHSEVQMKELVLNQEFLMYQLMSQRKNSLRILLMTKVTEDKGDGEEDQGLNIGEDERHVEEEEEDELYRDIKINQGRGIQADIKVKDSHVTLTLVNPDGQQQRSSVSSQFVTTQRDNDEFLKTIDEIIKKIIKEHVKEQVKVQVSKILPRIEQAVNEQLKAKVLTRSSHSSKTSYAVAADLSEMELKKILIEKMEGNKRRDDDADKDEEPFAGPDQGSKRRREGKEPGLASAPIETATRSAGRSTQGSRSRQALASESALAEEPMQTTSHMEEPSHLEFDTGAEDQPIVQSPQHPEWFSQQQKPPSLDRAWNKTVPAVHESIQPWISKLAKQDDTYSSFNELIGPTYELMKGSCKSLVELEYHLEEVFKATTDQLDWVNPEGASCRKYTTSITKTKAADYGNIKWIEDLVPRTMWIEEPIGYDKHALWEVSHWGRKRQQFYDFAVNRESARDVYLKRRIIAVIELKIVEWHSYKHLD
nr:hypothetical protein [Tanacetum cinerariifolium]